MKSKPENQVRTALHQALLNLPEPLLVAVSGGMDSLALLHALVELKYRPVVAHFNHGWRVESGEEAQRVKDLARTYRLRYIGGKARPSRQRDEASARALRYRFFAQAAQRAETTHVILAHHADDQVETFLLQLFRGSGGGSGMDPIHQRDGLTLHRPWLRFWRQDLLHYAQQVQLTWCVDASNADVRYRRNRLRLRVIPYLTQQFGPMLRQTLWRAAEIRRAENAWLDALCLEPAQQEQLLIRPLRALPLAQQRRIIWLWLAHHQVRDVGFLEVEAVRGLIEQAIPAKINLSQNRHARRRAGAIFIEPPTLNP